MQAPNVFFYREGEGGRREGEAHLLPARTQTNTTYLRPRVGKMRQLRSITRSVERTLVDDTAAEISSSVGLTSVELAAS